MLDKFGKLGKADISVHLKQRGAYTEFKFASELPILLTPQEITDLFEFLGEWIIENNLKPSFLKEKE
jgi:hypothetical protein